MKTLAITSRSRQRGLATVEMVIVAPFLLLMMLMVSELGRALFQYNALSQAVRDGARYYSAPATFDSDYADLTPAEIVERTRNLVTYGISTPGDGDAPLLPGALTVSDPMVTTDATGTYATVTATYTFQFMAGNPLSGMLHLLGSAGLEDTLTMTASSTMRMI